MLNTILSGTSTLTLQPALRNNIIPLINIIVPNVVIKEGICPFVVIKPFIKPKDEAVAKTKKKQYMQGSPALASIANNIEEKAKIEPTERSNSPAIIRNPTPRAIIPNSADTFNMDATVSKLKKSLVFAKPKNINITKYPISGANRGYFKYLIIDIE